jgi:hypothetical protein
MLEYNIVIDQLYPPATLLLVLGPGTHWEGGWLGPRAGLNNKEK